MILLLLLFFAGLILLTAGAEAFVRGSASIAIKFGLSPLVVGFTIVAFGTSSPELFVSVKSALSGFPGITVGNVLGSNIANGALILGVGAVLTPLTVHRQIIKRDLPYMLFISALCFFLLFDRELSRVDSLVLFIVFIVYLAFTVVMARREKNANSTPDSAAPGKKGIVLGLLIVGGIAGLVYGSHLMVDAAVRLARQLNISETIIGISVTAIGTSLPELAASIMAVIKKETDIAIGNVIGSNVFNLGLVLGSAGIISPFSVPELRYIDLACMVLFSLVLLPFLSTGFRLNRWEGATLLILYIGYISLLWI
ncbi:MAG: calcium/sodium antiporter [Chitinivibrionales bacterium]|nr:calcium/sodium antiporter [Chitinivibrionales bacterium]